MWSTDADSGVRGRAFGSIGRPQSWQVQPSRSRTSTRIWDQRPLYALAAMAQWWHGPARDPGAL
jgi:hypothetical protein